MKPTAHKATWHVFTNDGIFGGAFTARMPKWYWVAYGPRGTDSGVEAESGDAVHKAVCAAALLDEPRPKKAAA